jgi:hypothetical protein
MYDSIRSNKNVKRCANTFARALFTYLPTSPQKDVCEHMQDDKASDCQCFFDNTQFCTPHVAFGIEIISMKSSPLQSFFIECEMIYQEAQHTTRDEFEVVVNMS